MFLMFLRVSRYLIFSSIILKMLGSMEHSSRKMLLNLRCRSPTLPAF